MSKPILCLDFDGVCHSYTSGWKGATTIPDPPVDGLDTFLTEAIKEFSVYIYSSRSNEENGIVAMYEWFRANTNDEIADALTFPLEKPPAFVTLDDRAITFTGVWPSIEALKTFKPWNKKV